MSDDSQPIIDVALRSADPAELKPDERYAIVVPADGSLKIVDPQPDDQLDHPRRAKGSTRVLTVDSFAALWEKHSEETSELFADPVALTVTAVLNADAGAAAAAGHRDHLLILACQKTVAWKAWEALDGRLLPQQEFAEHLEDRAIDVVNPSSAEMLDLAQSFEGTTKVEWKSAEVLGSGQRALRYEETMTAKAGQKGDVEIPSTFELGIAPFEGTERFKVVARFRYRVRDGHLLIGYKLERPEDLLRQAFDDLTSSASEACGASILTGTAPPAR